MTIQLDVHAAPASLTELLLEKVGPALGFGRVSGVTEVAIQYDLLPGGSANPKYIPACPVTISSISRRVSRMVKRKSGCLTRLRSMAERP
jgi:hypothetical protein